MKLKLLVTLVLMFGCLAMAVVYSTTASLDGTNPPHAVDTDGKAIPDSSATQPSKPVILSKDIHDDKYGEMKPEANLNVSELAAWTLVANLVLNLDEVLNKG